MKSKSINHFLGFQGQPAIRLIAFTMMNCSMSTALATPWNVIAGGAIAPLPPTTYSLCNSTTGSCSPQTGTDTKVSGGVSNFDHYSLASANLATGQLKIEASAPTYQNSNANASFLETLKFAFPTGTVDPIDIGFSMSLYGSYQDGSQVGASIALKSPPGPGYSSLIGTYLYQGTFLGSGNNPVYGDMFEISNPGAGSSASQAAGNWTTFGPDLFEGIISIFPTLDPTLEISVTLFGTGVFDLSHTGTVWLDLSGLPEGSTVSSASGVFLSESPINPVPIPATLPLFASALGALGFVMNRGRKNNRVLGE